jgi:hypothetical protein
MVACRAFHNLSFLIALGDHWRYSEIRRSANMLLSSWSETKDPMFRVKVRTKKFVGTGNQILLGFVLSFFDIVSGMI